MKKSYDVVICGGGMVGTAMLSKLEKDPVFEDKSLLLLEAGPQIEKDKTNNQFSNRTCALSKASVGLLSSIGAWQNIAENRIREVHAMRVWDSSSDASLSFGGDASKDGVACIVENDEIQASLVRSLTGRAELRYNAAVQEYDVGVDGVKITLLGGDELTTKLVIGADSFKSTLRSSLGINSIAWDYNQSALVANLRISQDVSDNRTAWQRFLSTGPIALLPLSDLHSNMIWSTSPSECARLKSLSSTDLVAEINAALTGDRELNAAVQGMTAALRGAASTLGIDTGGRQLPPLIIDVEPDSVASFPLSLMHASQYVRHRAALIGDAAHRIHPMCGQGVNLGFGDVIELSQQLSNAVYNGKEIGDLEHLLTYETNRQRKAVLSLAGTDVLAKMKGNGTLLSGLRSLSLQFANLCPPIKNQLQKIASS